MEDTMLNKNIVISAVEQKTTETGKSFIKITDEKGLKYTIWCIKKDGTEGKAFQYFKTLGFEAVGKTVGIGYKEEQGEYEGKPVTYRTIVMMGGATADSSHSTPTTSTPSNTGLEQRVAKLETEVAYLKGKLTSREVTTEELATEFGGTITSQAPTFTSQVPTQEIRVEDIPF
jgi:hypothetical protein